jgi:class 3 adenylate cyclase
VFRGPRTDYAVADGAHIAYQVLGEQGPDIVFMPHWFGNVEAHWDLPPLARFTRRLAELGRIVLFDRRGSGLSDAAPQGGPFLESFADDLRAVMDAAGVEAATLVAGDTAGLVAIMFSATFLDRVRSLVLVNSFPGLVPREEYPDGLPPEEVEQHRADMLRIWLDGDVSRVAPSLACNPGAAAQVIRFLRMSASPAAAYRTRCQVLDLDLREVLATISVPTLVIHRKEDLFFGLGHGRYLAEHIGGAVLDEVPGGDHLMYTEDPDSILTAIERFVLGERRVERSDRVLATVLFTDIVESTSTAARVGDRRWRDLLDSYDREVARNMDLFRGTTVKSTGDGTLATFDGPARAIQCACALRDAAVLLGVALRAGLHTGEIEVRGGDVSGIAVHIAQRVQELARPGEVLVSRTITDLVAGSDINFLDNGQHQLRGVPGSWHLFRAEA